MSARADATLAAIATGLAAVHVEGAFRLDDLVRGLCWTDRGRMPWAGDTDALTGYYLRRAGYAFPTNVRGVWYIAPAGLNAVAAVRAARGGAA